MGIGDPYHKHPLRIVVFPSSDCFHCDLPIASGYGCKDCNYYIHDWCRDLPIAFRHPLHDQHLLTPFEPSPDSSSSNSPNLLCNECLNPCVGRFSYQCTTCQLFFHLKCLFTLNHDKHQHPLFLSHTMFSCMFNNKGCKVCGSGFCGFFFNSERRDFYIHPECSLIPLEIKHRHVHKLTLRHNFPEECDQVYCDLCEDRDGEMDCEQSYYYCKDCDYIAHVNCCITQPKEDVLICERFTHEHPLRTNKTKTLLSCTQCSYTVLEYTLEYPSLVKHPLHPHHTLLFCSKETDNFNCTECNFSMDGEQFVKFTHPLWRYDLKFICKKNMFRCDACGELGKGSRIGCYHVDYDCEFDLHLECFALPGKLEHESHSNHPLYLRWLKKSTFRYCSICTKEMYPHIWFYYCQECDYAAHMDCVAGDLLWTLRSSIKNQPDFCAIIQPDESSFKYRIADMRPLPAPSFFYNDDIDSRLALEVDDSDLGTPTDGYELSCPRCDSLIPTQDSYTNIKGWKSSFRENSITFSNDLTPSESEPLTFLDEQMIDELCCSICGLSIFPPTYSCASCQIFFHKSCAELPPIITYNETPYFLDETPPFSKGLSNCTTCKFPICSWAYLSEASGFIFDVQCAAGAPLVNSTYHNHVLRFQRVYVIEQEFFLPVIRCKACEVILEKDEVVMECPDCNFYLHLECGLLPAVIKHRIHQHPLELATDLALFDCEYICDVCEKDLNPDLWAYRCVDICGKYATSHVSCVITSKKKCHFSYDLECQTWTEEEQLEFRTKERERGKRTVN